MNPERVCIFVSSLEAKNGIARVISEIAWYFKDKAVIFTSKYKPNLTHKIPRNTKVLKIKPGLYNGFIGLPLFLQAGGWKIVRFVKRKKGISTLNPHGIHTIILASLIKLLLLSRKLKNSAFIYDREEFILPLNSSVFRRIQQKIDLLLIRVLLKIKIIDEILVLDNTMAQLVRRLLNTDRVKIIRIGVSHSIVGLSEKRKWDLSEKLKKIVKKKSGIKLFFQGILIPRRRVEDLLKALSLLIKNNKTNTILYIGGSLHRDVQYTNVIYRMVKNLHLNEHVYFLGELSEAELAYMYRTCDIFIFLGDNQTWGLAPLEAMVFKKPVIVSTGCGVNEVLDKNVAILIPPKEPTFIRDAIILLINNKNLREKLGRNAQNYVLRELMFANTANKLKKLWKINN